MTVKFSGSVSLNNVIIGLDVPSRLYDNGEGGSFYIVEPQYCWQDTARTIPADTVGQFVARVDDNSGNNVPALQSDALKQPTLQFDGTHWYVLFDRVRGDHFLIDYGIPMIATVINAGKTGTVAYDINMSLDYNPGWSSQKGFWAVSGKYLWGQYIDDYWYKPFYPDLANRGYGFALVQGPMAEYKVDATRDYFIARGAGNKYENETAIAAFLTGNEITKIWQKTIDWSNVECLGFYKTSHALPTPDPQPSVFSFVYNLLDFDFNKILTPKLTEVGIVANFYKTSWDNGGGPTYPIVYNVPNATKVSMFEVSSFSDVDISPIGDAAQVTVACQFVGSTVITTMDVSGWDTSNFTDVSWFASEARALVALDVSNWDTSSMIQIGHFAQNCPALTTLDVSNWDTSNVTYLRGFAIDAPLLELDVSNWNTSKVDRFLQFIQQCDVLTTLDVSNWDTRGTNGMSYAFYSIAESATSLANVITDVDVNGAPIMTPTPVTTGPFVGTATDYTRAFFGTNLTQRSIDNILVRIESNGTSGGKFGQSGGSAPSAIGQAAITALRSRGWTVTVTGGF